MARPWPASEGENMKPCEGKHETPNGPGPGGVDHGATMVSPRNSGRCGSWRVHGQPRQRTAARTDAVKPRPCLAHGYARTVIVRGPSTNACVKPRPCLAHGYATAHALPYCVGENMKPHEGKHETLHTRHIAYWFLATLTLIISGMWNL